MVSVSCLIEQRPQARRFAQREPARDGPRQTWRMSGDNFVDLMVVGASTTVFIEAATLTLASFGE
jgi:hypothetical protein